MSTFHVASDRNTTLTIDGSGDRWIIDPGITLQDPDIGIDIATAASNNRIDIRGTISSDEDNIVDRGTGTVIVIASTGRVIGDDGIFCVNDSSVTNNGRIDLMGDGVGFYDRGSISNSGFIRTGSIAVSIGDGSVDNLDGGVIRSATYGVSSNSLSGDVVRITNDGLIVGKVGAINGLVGQEFIVNRGEMRGAIELDDGDDRFDTRLGTVDHDIAGGKGNDTLTVSNGSIRLLEAFGEGSDTVRSTVSYSLNAEVETLVLLGKTDSTGKGNDGINTLTGNQGDNRLVGFRNNDWLDGRGGSDRLTGGLGDQDTFVFSTGYGRDTITDFEDGTDRIDFRGFKGIASYTDLVDNHAKDTDAGLVLSVGADRLLVQGMTLAQLDEAEVYLV